MIDVYCLGQIKKKSMPDIEKVNEYIHFQLKPGTFYTTVVYKLKRTQKQHLIWSWHRWINFWKPSDLSEKALNIYYPMFVNVKTFRDDSSFYYFKKYKEEDLMPIQDYFCKYCPEFL